MTEHYVCNIAVFGICDYTLRMVSSEFYLFGLFFQKKKKKRVGCPALKDQFVIESPLLPARGIALNKNKKKVFFSQPPSLLKTTLDPTISW